MNPVSKYQARSSYYKDRVSTTERLINVPEKLHGNAIPHTREQIDHREDERKLADREPTWEYL